MSSSRAKKKRDESHEEGEREEDERFVRERCFSDREMFGWIMENNGEEDARVVRCMTSNNLDNRLDRFILSVIILLS